MAEKKEMEKEKRKRRVMGDAFWKLKSFEKRLRKFQENLNEWETKKAEELGLYMDQINWSTGAVFDPLAEIQEGRVINARVISRLGFDVLREHREQMEEVKQLNKEMVDYRDDLSKHLHIWPDMIDLKNGVISDESYEGINPDDQPDKDIEQEKK